MSHVTCNTMYVTFLCGKTSGASWWRVRYQRGLPRLVNRPGVAGAVLQAPL